MLQIFKSNLGEIFVSFKVISKILLFDLYKNKKNIKIHNLYTNNIGSNFYIEVTIGLSNKKENKFDEINSLIYEKIERNLKNNFNILPKNISIIYQNKN